MKYTKQRWTFQETIMTNCNLEEDWRFEWPVKLFVTGTKVTTATKSFHAEDNFSCFILLQKRHVSHTVRNLNTLTVSNEIRRELPRLQTEYESESVCQHGRPVTFCNSTKWSWNQPLRFATVTPITLGGWMFGMRNNDFSKNSKLNYSGKTC